MKVTWENQDIRPGRRVRKPGTDETYIIGYDPEFHTKAEPAFCTVSLNDGMLSRKGLGHAEMAAFLNETHSQPTELLDGNGGD